MPVTHRLVVAAIVDAVIAVARQSAIAAHHPVVPRFVARAVVRRVAARTVVRQIVRQHAARPVLLLAVSRVLPRVRCRPAITVVQTHNSSA